MSISLSQVFLAAALILFILYIVRLRSDLLDRLVYLLCAILGIILVAAPNLSTNVANLLGIGRGADLLFYLAIIAGLFYVVGTRSRISRLEQQLTQLVREQAIASPIQEQPQEERKTAG